MLNQQASLDHIFLALADPTRRAIVERLTHGPETVSGLARPFAMSLSAVMQHLAALESAGLIVSRKTGRVRTCQIEPGALAVMERWIAARRGEWERRLDRLGAVLNDMKQEGQNDAEHG